MASKKSSKKSIATPKKKPVVKAAKPVVKKVAKPAPIKATAAAATKVKKTVAAPAPVVPAKPKNGKNQAGISARDLQGYQDLLLEKRRELLGDVNSMEDEALRSSGGQANLSNLPIHMADMGTDNYEQEFTLGLVEKDRNLLRDIYAALGKIQDGSYGICEGTGKPIAKARLEAQPWARFSIEHARKLEQRRLR